MMMICCMCGHMRLGWISNVVIRDKVGVVSIEIEDKMREARLRWFGYIKSMHALVSRCERIDLSECRMGRGKPRKSWSEVIGLDLKTSLHRHNLKTLGLTEDMTHDRRLWRPKLKVADFR